MDVPGFAFVTGAASGIGKACAQGFLDEGCAGVALVDLDIIKLEQTRSELIANLNSNGQTCAPNGINGNGYQNGDGHHHTPRIEIFSVNVTDEQEVITTVQEAARVFGRLDYVVNAAGIAGKHAGGVAFAETNDWQRILDVNLNGSFYVLRAAAEVMLKQKPLQSRLRSRAPQRGSIINFSSIQGLVGITQSAAYAASKTAILGLTRSASEDYANDGIRINAICPGYTETPLTTKNPQVLAAMEQRVSTAVPMERMGKPEEIADGVLYLAGGRSSFVTGSALSVDGGYVSR